MKHIYIFCLNLTSSGMMYGIGTYMQQMIEFLKNRNDVALNIVELHSNEKEFCLKENEGYRMLCFPKMAFSPESYYNQIYNRNVWYILQTFIAPEPSDQLIFHLNFNTDYSLIEHLRQKYPACRIFYTVHFLTYPLFYHDRPFEASHERDKMILSLVNKVICLSSTTREMLLRDYHVSEDKIEMIYNGLKDEGQLITRQEKNLLRAKYFFDSGDLILLFVGRVEAVKGVQFVIESFKKIIAVYPNARLIIAGNGALHQFLTVADGYWSRITFTGHLLKERLHDFYRMADVGVIPYFKEQCSYTVLEMMMHRLPLVTTDEVIGMLDNENAQYALPVQRNEKETYISVDELVVKIIKAVHDREYSARIRVNYENRFSLPQMKKKYLKMFGVE